MEIIYSQIEKIREEKRNHRLVIFVGAGVSKNSGACSWWELVKEIADKIKSRFKDKICLIGFDVKTYYQVLSEVCVSQERLKKLENIENQELSEICRILNKEKKVAYEEMKIMKSNILHIINS